MKQTFLKFSKLKKYDYLFSLDEINNDRFNSLNALCNRVYFERSFYVSNKYLLFSFYIDSTFEGNTYLNTFTYPKILTKYCRTNITEVYKYYGNILLLNDKPLIYFDSTTDTFVISNKISSEDLDYFFKIMKRKTTYYNFIYYLKYKYTDDLEIESTVYIKNNSNEDYNIISKVIGLGNQLKYHLLLNDGNYYYFDMMKVVNPELIKNKLNITEINYIEDPALIKARRKDFINYDELTPREFEEDEDEDEDEWREEEEEELEREEDDDDYDDEEDEDEYSRDDVGSNFTDLISNESFTTQATTVSSVGSGTESTSDTNHWLFA